MYSKNSSRRTSVTVAVAAIGLLAAGCSSQSSGTTSSAAATNNPTAVVASAAPASGAGCTATSQGYPKVSIKGAKVGFSQSEPETAAFRIAETQSMVDEAAKQGATLIKTDANSQIAKQVTDIEGMLNQGVQLLIVAPLNSDGLQPAFDAAKAKHVPVITVDRLVNSTACTDYLTFIGSDFVSQGKRAADSMIAATGGTGKVAILLGSSGNGVTTDRTSGFVDEIKTAAGLSIVAQQTANFARTDGQTVMASLLQAHPDITAVYAENDEMGIGAVTAIKAAGKKPGTDIKVVSVDGTHDAVQLLVNGEYNGVIESNPRFGPLAFKALADFEGDTAVPAKIVIKDGEYTPSNATANLANAF
ncbi:MAG: ABC transporter substrate-binding protein [Cellulomonas sp.]|uniref:ABC transporter substrate-binding protein n=1 Tax=Cellulomonas sp. TaxID=40001 RepID=UPI001856416C|nr:ABC transporter substrate-binding protein [Cellulomonas sp.]NMM30076.1 ABC transporter substrate-binding protein [Cellulomonas sp.]